MPEDFQRRIASREREIASIEPGDIRIRILGTVIDKKGDRFIIDDGTGKITVSSEHEVQLNQLVRVFGRAIPTEEGTELQGEIVQDMSGLDLTLLERVKGLKM